MSRTSRFAALAVTAALVLVTALALTSCTRIGEKAAADPRMEVKLLLDNYVDAMNRSDSTGVMAAYAPDSQATLAGVEHFVRGPQAVAWPNGEGLLPMGQNAYAIDSLDVIPIERNHALALVVFAVDPSDQDIPAFHTTATYILEKSGAKWHIIHAHVCPAREM
jgi:ketosteroid isomerase-like protein